MPRSPATSLTNRNSGAESTGTPRAIRVALLLTAIGALVDVALASEFPERECCDLPDEPDGAVSVHRGGGGGGGVAGATGGFGPLPEHYDVHYQAPTDVLFVPSGSVPEVLDPVDADLDPFDDNDFRLPEFIPELSPPDLHPATAVPTDTDNNLRSTTGLNHGRPANAMMNCLLAHELCTKDASCMSVKTVIRHICGPETVACSTTTVTKCQAGLRTLQAFPYFHPTCLCREPSVDPHCNAFRDFLFDHPCMVAAQREPDPYPIHALPTCSHALDVCRKDQSCVRMYEEFREQCKQRDGTCRDREACHVAWRNLRMTPLFGCFCPSTQHKKCERLYAFIYNNTCVGCGRSCLHAGSALSTSPYVTDPTPNDEHDAPSKSLDRPKRHAKSLVPPAPVPPGKLSFTNDGWAPVSAASASADDSPDPSAQSPTVGTTTLKQEPALGVSAESGRDGNEEPSTSLSNSPAPIDISTTSATGLTSRGGVLSSWSTTSATSTTTSASVTEAPNPSTLHGVEHISTSHNHHHDHHHEHGRSTDHDDSVEEHDYGGTLYPARWPMVDDDDAAAAGSWQAALGRQNEADAHQIETRLMINLAGSTRQPTSSPSSAGTSSADHDMMAGSIDVSETSHFVHNAFMNTRIGNASSPGATGRSAGSSSSNSHASGDDVATPATTTMSGAANLHNRIYSIYQSTCHRAMASCQSNVACRRQLEPMMRYCNGIHANQRLTGASETCHRDLCMQSVQGFYKDAPLNLTLEVAFCVCKKSANRNDECLIAQERLHPDCARRPERYHPSSSGTSSAVVGGHPDGGVPSPLMMPACHQLADECKNHPDCKPRLEFYVQACAVDTVTKGCAGLPSICRRAVLDILGTDLRTSCNCKATQQHADVAAMYDCLEWQRLLWLNPCVVEAQRDYHKSQGNLKVVTVPSSTVDAMTTATLGGTTGSTGAWWTPSTTGVGGRQTTQPWYSTAEIDITHPIPTGRTYRPSTNYANSARTETSMETIASTENRLSSTSSSAGTTQTTVRPTTPAKMCTLERPSMGTIYFPEGSSKRLYQDDDPDCSELCRCDIGQRVTCAIVSCAERKSCQTSVAVYAHAATAFQAYRGECLCFSGKFVCAKPDPGHYSLPSGIFLFIGYSRADERAIYQITYQNVSRYLFSSIRRLMESKRDPESECRISVHDQIEENVIFRIELTTFDDHRLNNSVTLDMLTQEKAQCLPLANEIRRLINKGLQEVKEDGILSIIKVADTAAIMPEPRRSSSANFRNPELFCKLIVSLVTLSISRRILS